LRSLLDIEPGEARLVGALCAASFVLGFSLVLLRTAADTLFRVHFHTEDLPYVFFATLVLVPATGILYSRLQERLGDRSADWHLPRISFAWCSSGDAVTTISTCGRRGSAHATT
jgi:hypothetical protein